MPGVQRFCPLCDRAFIEGEAVLACAGCGVLHHPSCWVKNDGCATAGDHDQTSAAQAYRSGLAGAAPEPSAAEGTRVQSRDGTTRVVVQPPSVVPLGPIDPDVPRHVITDPSLEEPLAPRPEPRLASRPLEPAGLPVRHGRYVPPDEEPLPAATRKPMPDGLYRGRGWLQYWYVPVAGLVVIGVAALVIWVIGTLTGGGDDNVPGAVFVASPTPEPTTAAVATQPPAGSPTAATASVSPSPTSRPTGGKFEIGQVLVVTGAGDCLNVRTEPDRTTPAPAIVCLSDGETVTVTGGPQNADAFTWWKVNTKLGEGWAVEDYLQKQ